MSHRTRTSHPTACHPTAARSMPVRTAISAVAFTAFGLLAVACSDSKSISSADDSSTTTSDTPLVVPATTTADSTLETTTTVAAVETTLAPETTVAATVAPPPPPAADCPSAVAPSGAAISLVTTEGDWDGDGAADTAVSWAEPVGGGLDWYVRTEITGGPSSSVALGDLGVGYAAVMGAVDVDFSLGAPEGSNEDEILATVGVSSSGYLVGVFGVNDSGCAFQFDDGAGATFQMATTGTIGQLSGFRCEGAAGSQFLVKLEASSGDEVTWSTRDYRIRRQADQSLVLDPALTGSLAAADLALAEYGQANCGGFTYFDEFNDGGGDY